MSESTAKQNQTVRPPNRNSTLDELAEYIKGSLAEATSLGRRNTVAIYHAGHAVALAHRRLKKRGAWKRWLADHDIARTTAYEAEQIYRGCGSVKRAPSMTLTEARTAFVTNGKRHNARQNGSHAEAPVDESGPEFGSISCGGNAGVALVIAKILQQITPAASEMPLLVARTWDARARQAHTQRVCHPTHPRTGAGIRTMTALDLFCGGRRFLGIELSRRYCEEAQERLRTGERPA